MHLPLLIGQIPLSTQSPAKRLVSEPSVTARVAYCRGLIALPEATVVVVTFSFVVIFVMTLVDVLLLSLLSSLLSFASSPR
jgi:hypothetical protein